jgi:O-antigen ligase
MNRRLRTRVLVCLGGLLVSLTLAGMVLAAMRRVLLQTRTVSYTPLSGEATWEGDWKFSELGADPSPAGTERVTIPFVGTDLALRVRRGNYRAYFFVSVDGRPANRLPREERGAYLVLTSPDYAPQVVTLPVAAGLDDGPHVAVVVAERGWEQWPLTGWRVSRTPDTTAYRWALAGLSALGLACLGGMVWWGSRNQEARGKRQDARGEKQDARGKKHPASCILHPASCILHPASCILHPASCILHPASSTFIAAILIAATVFYFSPWLPLTLVAGLALAALILVRLDLGLALVAATAPFYLHPRPLFGKAFSMAEIATLLCVLSWGIRQIGHRQHATRKPPISILHPPSSILHPPSSLDLAVLFFILASSASLLVAAYRHVALRELRVLILEPALFYLMLRTSRLDGKAMWRVVDLFVLGAVAVAAIGLVQYALGLNVITAEEGFRRLCSVYGSPNSVGLYLGRVLPVLVAVALFGRTRGRRVTYSVAVVPVGLAVLLSFSKGALILGVPLSLLALGLLAGGPWLWASLGTVVVAAASAIPLLRTPRFASLLDTRRGTTFFRLHLWRASWTMFREHLWLGVGPDNFLYQYRSRYILPAAWQEPDLSQAHNVFLDYATRVGIAGLLAGGWLQVAFWRLALPLRRLADGPADRNAAHDRRALALGLMGSMVNFLAHGLVDASYFLVDLAFAFFLTLGLVQWLTRRETDEIET